MKLAPLILTVINAVVWGGLSWMGRGGIAYIESQHAPGYPNLGQIQFYLAFPLLMLSVALVPAVLLSQTKWSVFGSLWSVLTLLAVIPYLFYYGGGV